MRFIWRLRAECNRATRLTGYEAHRLTGEKTYMTADTPNVTMAANVVNLKFNDPVNATILAAAELRAQGADAVVVVAHMGGRCTETHDPNDLSSCNANNEAPQLIEKLPRGTIDAYFAGHTHSQMRHYINGVATLQASPYSREFATLDLWVDTANNKVTK